MCDESLRQPATTVYTNSQQLHKLGRRQKPTGEHDLLQPVGRYINNSAPRPRNSSAPGLVSSSSGFSAASLQGSLGQTVLLVLTHLAHLHGAVADEISMGGGSQHSPPSGQATKPGKTSEKPRAATAKDIFG